MKTYALIGLLALVAVTVLVTELRPAISAPVAAFNQLLSGK
jgi:hypothetical protein